ncbi:MAG: dephospho-CoA kinase [Muribaculum sp.]|nr:dephospho-CoA kinase [Muribaculaceae bacterium]MCM1080543.1 dephospho-CoA kinase [Muribaculum sp.]
MGKRTELTVIAGGIGSGKSVVSRILTCMGYPVYDCDSRAKMIMDSSDEIRRRLADEISPETIGYDGKINRELLSKMVFSDKSVLNQLNAIVHKAVRDDIDRWRLSLPDNTDRAWVECAIIYESGIDKIVNCVWDVTAPEELRIRRVMSRNAMSSVDVRKRISAQNIAVVNPHNNIREIINDGVLPLLPQILRLISER